MLSPHETTINTPKSLRVSARSLSSRLPIQHISFPTFTSSSSHSTLGYSATLVLSFRWVVPCRTSSTHLHTHSSPISNCIGPASAATRAASFKSLYRKRAGATCHPYDYSVDARSRYNTRTSGLFRETAVKHRARDIMGLRQHFSGVRNCSGHTC